MSQVEYMYKFFLCNYFVQNWQYELIYACHAKLSIYSNLTKASVTMQMKECTLTFSNPCPFMFILRLQGSSMIPVLEKCEQTGGEFTGIDGPEIKKSKDISEL